MTKLIDLAVEHFNSLGVREVIIPEWGDTKVFMKNFSLEDKAKLSARAQEDTWDYLCYTVIFGLVDGEGKRYVLEVNAVPGWKALSKVLDVDIASEVISHVVRRVKERR